MLRHRAVSTRFRLNKEILASRLLATLAAAGLLAVAVTRVLGLGAVQAAHPRHWLVGIACCLLGVRIVAHTRRNPVGWLVLVMGLCSALAVAATAWSAQVFFLAWLGVWVWWPSYALLPVTILVFPGGRLLSPRWRAAMVVSLLGVLLPMTGIAWDAWDAPATFWSEATDGEPSGGGGLPVLTTVVGLLLLFLGLLCSLVSLVLRWRRAGKTQRRLLLWTTVCTALLFPAWLFEFLGATWGAWVVAAAFPLAAIISILWYGLYDIDLLIHRSLLYGLLTAILTAAYLVVVLVFASSLPAEADVIGTIAVVLLLGPLHQRLRGLVNRWLYGDRSDPYRALSQLGEQLANPLPPERALFEVARSIGEALKLPYVAIQEGPHGRPRLLATHGKSRQWTQVPYPLKQDGSPVGTLIVEVRAPEEHFSWREHKLLTDLARQVALAVRSARLAEDLRRAHVEREEDLEHVTSELHDAVGPSVTGIRLQVDALRRQIDPTGTDTVSKLDQIIDDLTTVSLDVRDLARNVRPRELRCGLLSAVEHRAEQFEQADFAVSVTCDGALERLPDGVERAAYRIVGEALTNVERYANASSCQVKLTRTADGLTVSVVDDGDGIPPEASLGKGLDSMRRRCENRGGKFKIKSLPRGTKVEAYLPFKEPVMSVNTA